MIFSEILPIFAIEVAITPLGPSAPPGNALGNSSGNANGERYELNLKNLKFIWKRKI